MSRTLIPGLLGLLLLAGCGAAEPTSPLPPWRSDVPAALAEAAQAKRPVLLRFTAGWCPPCKEMERKVWPDATIQKALAPVIAIKVDADDPALSHLYQTHGVSGIPALVLLDASGKEIGRREGYQSPEQVTEFLASIP